MSTSNRLLIAACIALLAGCALKPQPDVKDSIAQASTAPQSWEDTRDMPSSPANVLEDGWWKLFHDPVLDKLVEDALAGNTNLLMARSRLESAAANLQIQDAAQLPTLSAQLGAPTYSRQISAATGKPYVSFTSAPAFSASYEVDLWQRLSSLSSAAQHEYRATQMDMESARLSIVSNVVDAYIGLRALDAQLEVARKTADSRAESLRLAQRQQVHGYRSALETQQSEVEYRAATRTLPELQQAIASQKRSLRVLLGALPEGDVPRGKTIETLSLPSIPQLGLPSELLRRRPDLAAAEERVIESDKQWTAARANMLPHINLAASWGGFTSSALSGDPFALWSLGGSILAPIFEGGRLKAQAELAGTREAQALLAYRSSVLNAFAEVEDQLSAWRSAREEETQVSAQRAALEQSTKVSRQRYAEGYSSHLDVLDAERNLYATQQAELKLHAAVLQAQVGVFRALGGGWQRPS